jgi:excisionase family DNA binding protein
LAENNRTSFQTQMSANGTNHQTIQVIDDSYHLATSTDSDTGIVRVSKAGDKRLMTYHEAAFYLNVGRSTLYDLVGRGEIPVVRLSRRCVRFRLQDLEELVDARLTRRPQ